MRHIVKSFCIAVTIASLPAAISAQRGEMPQLGLSQINIDPSSPLVDLNISESVTVKPDTAAFSTGVETTAPTAKEAIAQNGIKMQSVIAQLKGLGIGDRDVQTSQFSLTKLYTYPKSGKRRFRGYSVTNTVTAKLRDLSKLGDALDTLSAAGATEFNGPEFSLDNPQAAESEARDKAWATAYVQARYHAKKAGFADVRIVRVTEQIQRSTQSTYDVKAEYAIEAASAAADAAAAAMPGEPAIQAGEISVTVQLGLSFVMVR
jgi:uncharacterized protein